MELDLELLRASVSGIMMYCKEPSTKKALKKHANTIDLMIEGQELPIDHVVNAKRTCPECGSKKIIMFTSDLDICQKCNHQM